MCFLTRSLAYLIFWATNAIEQSPTIDRYPVYYIWTHLLKTTFFPFCRTVRPLLQWTLRWNLDGSFSFQIMTTYRWHFVCQIISYARPSFCCYFVTFIFQFWILQKSTMSFLALCSLIQYMTGLKSLTLVCPIRMTPINFAPRRIGDYLDAKMSSLLIFTFRII